MSGIKIFNSRSKKYETLEEEKVGMYMCGPTVYGKVHIGNLRTFLFGDVVFRTLKYFGKNVKYVMNITDVDDKIINLVSNMEELYTLTNKYETLFKENLIQLNVLLPEFHRVSDNMKNIQNLIRTLLNNGSAYETEDGSVYYDTSKNDKICSYFDIHLNDDNYHSNREIIKSEGVKNKNDFVLWKSRQSETKFKEKNIFWKDSYASDSSDLKSGRPGWHIECSAIAMDHLGKVTLHLGGEDLKFPHHTNEIAQSESACSDVFGKYWMHVSFLNLEHNEKEEKMSKSLGNVVYLENLIDKYNPLVIRMYLNSKHYQRTFTFSLEELNLYVDRLSDIYRTIVRLNNFVKKGDDIKEDNIKSNLPKDFLENFEKEILKPIYDNFNIGVSLEILEKKFTMIRKAKNINFKDANSLLELFNKLDSIFGILNPNLLLIDKETQEKIQERDLLREKKEYSKADGMRLNIQENYIFEDDSTGYIIFRKF